MKLNKSQIIQGMQSIMLVDSFDTTNPRSVGLGPPSLQCDCIYSTKNYRLFYIAVYNDKFKHLNITKDIEGMVFIDMHGNIIYLAHDVIAIEFEDVTKVVSTDTGSYDLSVDIHKFNQKSHFKTISLFCYPNHTFY